VLLEVVWRLQSVAHDLKRLNDGGEVRAMLALVVVAQSSCTLKDQTHWSRMAVVVLWIEARPRRRCHRSLQLYGPRYETVHVQRVASSRSMPVCLAT
jgi:hypothetical protein